MSGNPPLSIDLFAGAGGLSLGFRNLGFRSVFATDFDPVAAETYERNFPEVEFALTPIEKLSSKTVLARSQLNPGELDVLIGGPPCQAFSVYNHKRGFHDDRAQLFREYLRLVNDLRPKTLVIENVVGMLSLDGGRALIEIHAKLRALGYDVEHRVLEAERFGVPQERRRVIILASRVGPICWPEPSHQIAGDSQNGEAVPYTTVSEAIGDLPPLRLGDGVEDPVPYRSAPTCEYQRQMREMSSGVTHHISPSLGQVNVERMRHIPPGGSWRDIPIDLLPSGMKRARRSDHTKRYGRLHPEGLASTILTKCDLHWGAYIHPEQDRTLTVREAARFQSFPDRFVFAGSRGDQYRQVGNAVPPLLAAAVASSIRGMLDVDETEVRPARAS